MKWGCSPKSRAPIDNPQSIHARIVRLECCILWVRAGYRRPWERPEAGPVDEFSRSAQPLIREVPREVPGTSPAAGEA